MFDPVAISMPVLAALEALGVAVVFALLFVVAPAWALHRRMSQLRLSERFMAYLIYGNFCMVNVVLFLELVHISFAPTIALGYFALLCLTRWRLYGTSPKTFFMELYVYAEKLARRTITWRQVWAQRRVHPWLSLKSALRSCLHDLPSVLLLLLLMFNVVRVFGSYVVTDFGYLAADSPVHNYWINSLITNQPFVAGVYPMGYHCVVYAIHELSGIYVFSILRVLGLVQTFYFMLAMVAFLRAVCRSRFAPFVGLLPYAVALGADKDYWRYLCGIPQEYGMLFILPALWAAFKFFERLEAERKGELDGSMPKMSFWAAPSTLWLGMFAMGMSLTIAVHFYDFFALAFFILAGAFCYAARLVRPKFMWRTLVGGLAGLLSAALPMVIAFALGTPLQGSLGWGMDQITGAKAEATEAAESDKASESEQSSGQAQEKASEQNSEQQAVAAAADLVNAVNPTVASQLAGTSSAAAANSITAPRAALSSFSDRVVIALQQTVDAIRTRIGVVWESLGNVFGDWAGYGYLLFALATIVCGVLLWVFRQKDYAAQVATMGLALIFMAIELVSYGLPWLTLMDAERTTAFMQYLVPACLAVGVDGLVTLFTLWMKHSVARDAVSAVALAFLAAVSFMLFGLETPKQADRFEPDGNIVCLERILREYPNFKWTIVSANEELRMCEEFGYHTEINEVLNGMEHLFEWEGTTLDFSYRVLPASANVIIPTEHVFFFIEKIPSTINVLGAVPEGEPISEEWANNILPGLPTIMSYRGKNRYIEMSRMYYWAQEYRRRFPNEMHVFYEDDEIICYYLHQPEADWTDLYVEYGYNNVTAEKMVYELSGGEVSLNAELADGEKHSVSFVNATRAGIASQVENPEDRSPERATEEGGMGETYENNAQEGVEVVQEGGGVQ